ncbi:poly polymerase small subunit [Sea otter poxvirus]|uniref:Cap-specific mRNA (nucleoside-2'-O-)-methyltransferase n=1 Tax=Sea otter poxvirus TaxID=1416741 RepID=A0A2U9QHM7_9POXV|nr:poly polymerase small subunit [Sea otter poxvirus]AWU47111.1 poly polymerase small subunit [Sea otter poxvirus]
MNVKTMNKPYLYFDDIDGQEQYDRSIEDTAPAKFPSQGQLKLLLCELFFLNKLQIHGLLDNSTIVYLGSAPGTHIKWLYDHFIQLGVSLQWILIDGRKHDSILSNLNNVTIVTRFADEQYLRELRKKLRNRRIILISDVRTNKPGKEPSTDDLLNDYTLQNTTISVLRPAASIIKWRCPFPDQWIHEFYIPCGKELLQPFAPSYSAELRIISIHTKTPLQLRLITLEDAHIYENKMFYINNNIRKKIIINFDYPNQNYDIFHMYFLLSNILCHRTFNDTKSKVLFLHQSIFKFLKIPLSVTSKIKNEQIQRDIPFKDTVSKGRDTQRSIRYNK